MATRALDTAHTVATAQSEPAARTPSGERYLFGPIVDFLCLGGSSLLLLPLVLAIGGSEDYAGLAANMLIVAHVLNHPHFAASYQIFYRGFRQKALTASLGR